MNKKVTLPSGAILEVQVAPFAVSKALYMAMAEEVKGLKINASDEIDVNLFKDLFCAGVSSKKIEAALDECMKRCLYDNSKIDKDTFEPLEARGDYLVACFEVASENVQPFLKSLFAKYQGIFASLKKPQA